MSPPNSPFAMPACVLEDAQTIRDGDDVLFSDDERMLTEPNTVGGPTEPEIPEAMNTTSEHEPYPPSSDFDAPFSDAAGQPGASEDDVVLFQLAGTSNKRENEDDNEIHAEKHRYEEVDYSRSLRKELYEKEEVIGGLKSRLRQQGAVLSQEREAVHQQYTVFYNDAMGNVQRQFNEQRKAISDMQALLQQREVELNRLRSELEAQNQECATLKLGIQNDLEQAAQRHKQELDDLRKQFEIDVWKQMDEITQASTTNLASALQLRDRELEAKTIEIQKRMEEGLNQARVAMEVDKERELANMEQCYARQGINSVAATSSSQPPDASMDNEAEPSTAKTQGHTLAPRRPPGPAVTTLNLDEIKWIKRSRGVSRRTRLIRVHMDNNHEKPQARPALASDGHEPSETEPERHGPTTVSSMAEAVAKAIEVALRNVLGGGNTFGTPKRLPRWRRVEDQEVELEKVTEPSQHRDFILNEVQCLFKDRLGISQDADFITHAQAVLDDVHAYEYEDSPGPDLEALAFDLTQSYRSTWNSSILELLLCELQQRCDDQHWPVKKPDNYLREVLQNRYKKLRTTWMKAQPKLTKNGVQETPAEVEARLKYRRHAAVLDHIMKLKVETADNDLTAWEWLQRLIKSLGEHGMSSEESAVENKVEHVLRVKNMEWRRGVEQELDIVDLERVLDSDIFSPQGSKPVKRIRAPNNLTTSRDAVTGLPMALYDGAWIAGLTQRQLDSLAISNEEFIWMKVTLPTLSRFLQSGDSPFYWDTEDKEWCELRATTSGQDTFFTVIPPPDLPIPSTGPVTPPPSVAPVLPPPKLKPQQTRAPAAPAASNPTAPRTRAVTQAERDAMSSEPRELKISLPPIFDGDRWKANR
ncbi:hypothetical protein HYDPIDRAFT_25128 [Hydnomerulius pinastri MD-312]|nr:hypothetical protein HYDPIDRAFT_25128 [Hydnomerulius pinastri MD-312]